MRKCGVALGYFHLIKILCARVVATWREGIEDSEAQVEWVR